MNVDVTSMFFNSTIKDKTATPAWGTSIGQSKTKENRIETDIPGVNDIISGMIYRSVDNFASFDLSKMSKSREVILSSIFSKVYVNSRLLNGISFLLFLVREHSQSHEGRLILSYPPYATYSNGDSYIANQFAIDKIRESLGCENTGCWFVTSISIINQDELHFEALVVDKKNPQVYLSSQERSRLWNSIAAEETPVVDISEVSKSIPSSELCHLRAMRTKPFLLLAGISGTGKSRIVKEFAFKSCPDNAKLRKDKTSPGNYCLVEVKPNWHDSTELLGYESAISGSYYLTPFVKFLAKAMLYPETPFFVCLDEMNLAPVEQYFAEFLSVLESRKMVDGHIKSEPLIPADIFVKHENTLRAALFNTEKPKSSAYERVNSTSDESPSYGNENAAYNILMAEGLRIPENLVVIGTVNMDETTHQFSRKVIDRAMTIEMDIEDGEQPFQSFFEDAKEPDYVDAPLPKDIFLPRFVTAAQAIASLDEETAEFLKTNVPTKLAALNASLNDTPFKIAYRVQNELILFFSAIKADSSEKNNEAILTEALDGIMTMKVLPRIEGDEDLLGKPLKALATFTSDNNLSSSEAKVSEMTMRLERGHFTSFWP